MRSIWLGFAILSATAIGCGDHGGLPPSDLSVSTDMSIATDLASTDISIPDDARNFVTFGQFALDYAQRLCAHYMTCGTLDAAQLNACIERNIPHTGWDQDIEIMKGRMEINELQCLDAIKNLTCDRSNTHLLVNRCDIFLYVAHQTNSSTCLAGRECVSGRCQHGLDDAGSGFQPTGCAGTCAATLNTGDPCQFGQDCASDSYCNPTTHQCTKLAALGELCYAPGAPVKDFSKPACQYELNCPSFPTTPPSRCQTPTTQMTLHGACDPYQGTLTTTLAPCDTGMYCQIQYTAGAACSVAMPCTVQGAICMGAVCQNPTGGACEMKIASGMTCDPKYEGVFGTSSYKIDNQCIDGTYCYKLAAQAGYTCQALGAANADCHQFSPNIDTCKYALYCNGPDGKCVQWFSDQQGCDVNVHCASSSIFQNVCIADNADAGAYKTCQPAKNFGATCDPAFENSLCAPSDNVNTTYCAPAGTSGVCAPKCF